MKKYSQWMADSVIQRKTDLTSYWAYEFGLTLDGIAEVWHQTGERKYFDYINILFLIILSHLTLLY